MTIFIVCHLTKHNLSLCYIIQIFIRTDHIFSQWCHFKNVFKMLVLKYVSPMLRLKLLFFKSNLHLWKSKDMEVELLHFYCQNFFKLKKISDHLPPSSFPAYTSDNTGEREREKAKSRKGVPYK